jgi:hypothetical protein
LAAVAGASLVVSIIVTDRRSARAARRDRDG